MRKRSSATRRTSCPDATSSCTPTSAPATSSVAAASSRARRRSNGAPPKADCTCGCVEPAAADREGLVEQGEGVARRTGGAGGDELDRLGIGLDLLPTEDVGEVPDELFVREQVELEVLRARPQGGRHLLRIGGGEHEHHVLGRLLERLQQRVLGRRGQHVHLVDHVHLAAAGRAEAEMDALDEVAHRLDAVVRRRVELDEVEEGPRRDRAAVLALAARLAVVAQVQAVERPRQDARGRGLARAARAGEEVGVADAVLPHRVAERDRDVVLADQLGEPLRAVFAVQAVRRHGGHLTDAH